jgi:hypothetical protein
MRDLFSEREIWRNREDTSRKYSSKDRKLCKTCLGINADELTNPKYYKHVSSFFDLDTNCLLCRRFENHFQGRDGQLFLSTYWRSNGGAILDAYLKVMIKPRLLMTSGDAPRGSNNLNPEETWRETNIFVKAGTGECHFVVCQAPNELTI